MHLAICPERAKHKTRWFFVEQNSISAQWFIKYERIQELNQHVGLYEKRQALVGSWAEILPVAEGTKWTCVGD